MRERIALISGSVGAGHDGASHALAAELSDAGYRVEQYDFLRLLPGRAGSLLASSYGRELRTAPRTWGWLLAALERSRPAATGTKQLFARLAAKRTAEALQSRPPSAVVSTYPLASQVVGWLRRTGQLPVPALTYLTDLSVHTLWAASGVDRHLALHPVAAAQAQRLGARDVVVARPVVGRQFADTPTSPALRAAARTRYGIPDDRPVALVVAGSLGVGEVARTAREIAETGIAVPVTVCGHNDDLRREIKASGAGVALGWVDDMAALMPAGDLVVQNAGGLTSLEAMAAGVPVVTYRSLPGHGTTNAASLDAAGLARWIRRPEDLAATLRGVLHGALGHRQRAAVAAQAAQPAALDLIEELIPAAAARTATVRATAARQAAAPLAAVPGTAVPPARVPAGRVTG